VNIAKAAAASNAVKRTCYNRFAVKGGEALAVDIELKDISANPSILKPHFSQGEPVRVFDQGVFLFTATPDRPLSEDEDFYESDYSFVSEILRTEQLEREGKLAYVSLSEFLEKRSIRRGESIADVRN
jgi:hypothetical protein